MLQVEHPGVGLEVHIDVLAEGDHIVGVFLVEVHDLELAEEQVGRIDGVGVDLEPVAKIDLVVHAHRVQKDVDVVAGGHRADQRSRVGPLRHVGV